SLRVHVSSGPAGASGSGSGGRTGPRNSPGPAVAVSDRTGRPPSRVTVSGRNSCCLPCTTGSSRCTTVTPLRIGYRRPPATIVVVTRATSSSSASTAAPSLDHAPPPPCGAAALPDQLLVGSTSTRNALWFRISEELRHTATIAR